MNIHNLQMASCPLSQCVYAKSLRKTYQKCFWSDKMFKKSQPKVTSERQYLQTRVFIANLGEWRVKKIFLSLVHTIKAKLVFKSLYNKIFRMSQYKQVQMSESNVSNNQKHDRSPTSLQGQNTINQPPYSQNHDQQARFYEYNGQKSKLKNQPSMLAEAKVQEWTLQEENLLLQLHNKKGNKWVDIGRQLKKNDNTVKNHYHNRLRKGLRKLNKLIANKLHRQFQPFKPNIISKIIQTAQGVYAVKFGSKKQKSAKAYIFKNQMLSYNQLYNQQITQQLVLRIKQQIAELVEFEDSFKPIVKVPGPRKPTGRYKGKEIIGLLTQKFRAENRPQFFRGHPVSTDFKEKYSQPEPIIKKPQNLVIPSVTCSRTNLNTIQSFGNLPSIYEFNEGMYPSYQSLYYSACQQPSNDFYLNQYPSFISFNQPCPEKIPQWMSCAALEEAQYIPAEELINRLQANRSQI